MGTKIKAQTLAVPRQDDVRWVRAHRAELESYSGRWIAVLKGTVLAEGSSARDVADRLADRQVTGALITLVRPKRPANSFDIA